MKKFFAITAIMISGVTGFNTVLAQANSILLEDGTGNQLSSHSSIQEAYNNIPGTLTQAYKIQITNTYTAANETFPITFVSKAGASAANMITVYMMPSVIMMNVTYDATLSSAFVFDDADWIKINGRNGNGGVSLRIINPGQLGFPMMDFINGACNNLIDSCVFAPSTTNVSTVPVINFGQSPGNVSGNSNNTISGCRLNNTITGIKSEGSVNNPNVHNKICNNTIYAGSIAIMTNEGTGKLTIDSNFLQMDENPQTLVTQAIVSEALSDSLIVTRNRIRLYLYGNPKPHTGIFIKSTSGNNAYTFITNNFIYFQSFDNQLGIYTDEQTDIAGIAYDGNYAVKADIYHNTIRIMEKLANTITAPALSACFKRTGDNSGNIFNIRNNIFSTERIGGVNAEHLAMLLDNTTGNLTIDYNDYVSDAAQVVKYNNVLYNTLPPYQTAIGGANEVNSNTAVPEFPGPTDFHIYGGMVNDPLFYGVAIPGIPMDTEDDPRTNYYRGCDEYVINCTSEALIIYNPPNTLCEGDSFLFYTNYQWTGNGNTWQWQWRPAGTTIPFADIPGATHYVEILHLTQSSDLRVESSCVDNSFTDYSNTVTVTVDPLPSAGSIVETHTGLIYNFNTSTPLNITSFQWDFGDASPIDVNATPMHEYADTGTYTVTLIITNSCGSDTLTYTITPPVVAGIDDVASANSISLYPNPADKDIVISSRHSIKELTIYNTIGSVIFTDIIKKKEYTIDVSSLSVGSYVVRLKTEKGIVYKRMLVSR